MRKGKPATETHFRPPTAEEIAALEKIYAQVPSTECVGKCFDSCTSIHLSDIERARLLELGFNIPPRRTVRELEAEGAATGRVTACPALSALGACRVYDARPLICRAWPIVSDDAPGMACSYGCKPEPTVLVRRVRQPAKAGGRASRGRAVHRAIVRGGSEASEP